MQTEGTDTDIVKFPIDTGGTLEFRRKGDKYFCLSCPSHKKASSDGLAWSSVVTNHGPLVHNLKLSRKKMTATTLTPVTCTTCSREFRRATSEEDYNRHVTKCAEKVEKRANRERVKIRAQTNTKEKGPKTSSSNVVPSLSALSSSGITGAAFSQEPRHLPSPAFAPMSTEEEKDASQNQGPPPELHDFFLAEVLARPIPFPGDSDSTVTSDMFAEFSSTSLNCLLPPSPPEATSIELPLSSWMRTDLAVSQQLQPPTHSPREGTEAASQRSQATGLPRELHIFSLAEVLARGNIIDFNMERILNQMRVKLTDKEHVIESFGGDPSYFSQRASADRPARLMLHMFGGAVSYCFNRCKQMVRERKMMTYLPFDVSDEELRSELERCKLSMILHGGMLQGLSSNYFLIIGAHSRILWRAW
jgi:hypothetical protein